VAVERVLEASADDVGAPGPDLATGHGRVIPRAALGLARAPGAPGSSAPTFDNGTDADGR
jgi:hypothetical protein